MEVRPYRNSDPPRLAEVWRSQPSQRGLVQPMSTSLIERHVLSKPYFDRRGLLLAVEDGETLGFAHAGFGPDATRSHLDPARGVMSMLMARAADASSPAAAELLARGEHYLSSAGAQEVHAQGIDGSNPFYLGLYGGSHSWGVLASDARLLAFYSQHGYSEGGRTAVLQTELARFRCMVDRKQMALRRRTSVKVVLDPPSINWWECCTLGQFTVTRFELDSRDRAGPIATATFWDMESFSTAWGVRAAGLVDVRVIEAERRQGAATYLLAEAFRQLSQQAIALVEMQIPQSNTAALGLARKIGGQQVDEAVSYFKGCPK